jgi:hypothetical protein
MTEEQEKELAEVILRTRHWAFRAALPEIARALRRIVQESAEQRRGADKMIADYREIIRGIAAGKMTVDCTSTGKTKLRNMKKKIKRLTQAATGSGRWP